MSWTYAAEKLDEIWSMFFGSNKVKKKHVREGKLDLVMDIVQFSWVMAMLYLELFFTYSVDVFFLDVTSDSCPKRSRF